MILLGISLSIRPSADYKERRTSTRDKMPMAFSTSKIRRHLAVLIVGGSLLLVPLQSEGANSVQERSTKTEENFGQKVWLLVIDKLLIAAIAAAAGFWLSRLLENVKADLALQNERKRIRGEKQLDYLERQLSEFYYPLYIGLHVDGAVWNTILARDRGDDLREKIGEQIEKDVLLPNHEKMISIIQSKIHLAEADQGAFDLMLKYIRHASIYRAMRKADCFDKDPIHLDEPFPSDLLPTIEKTTGLLQQRYDSLVEPTPEPRK
jgi:hypothetical protein